MNKFVSPYVSTKQARFFPSFFSYKVDYITFSVEDYNLIDRIIRIPFVGVFWNAAGAASLATNGAVNWEWVAILTPGALVGSWLGVYLSSKISTRHIKKLFELVAILSGIYLIYQ
jgi:hypothetical protein